MTAVDDRIAELKGYAEEEGIDPYPPSEADLRTFLARCRIVPGIVLMDSGNFRATWRRGSDSVALEFCGNGNVQFVLFLRGAHGRRGFHGGDKVDRIEERLKVNGLTDLLGEPSSCI